MTPIITPKRPARPTNEAETKAGSTKIPKSDLKQIGKDRKQGPMIFFRKMYVCYREVA